jgi:integrase
VLSVWTAIQTIAIKENKMMKKPKYAGFYQEHIKNEFLANYDNIKTRKNFESRLRAIGVYEQLWGKDLYEFDGDEIQTILYQKQGTILAVSNVGRLIRTYINWAIEKGYREETSILDRLNSEYYERFAVMDFYTQQNILDMLNQKGKNLEEKIILLLLYEGFQTNEIPYLKYSDIDFDNQLITINNGERIIKNISTLLLELLKKSAEEIGYESSRGIKKYVKNSNGYIIQKLNTHTNDTDEVDYHKIHRAVKRFDKKLTPKDVTYAGMLYQAMLLYKEHGKLGQTQYVQIIERFNQKKVINNGYEVPPYAYLRNSLQINEDTVKIFYTEVNSADTQIQSNPLWSIKEQNGLVGEKIVYDFLSKEHPECHLVKPPDKEGYDIEVYRIGRRKADKKIIKRVEVKTVQNGGRTIHLTINEIDKASTYENYYIYLVNNLIEKYEIYIIPDPIAAFEMDIGELKRIFNTTIGEISVSSVKIKLKVEYLKSLTPITMNKEINEGYINSEPAVNE